MASNEETNAAGTDTRPPILDLHLSLMITDPPLLICCCACTREKLDLNSSEIHGISTTLLCSDLYSYSKPTSSAQKTLKKQEQSTSIVDPLDMLTHTTSAPVLSSPSTRVLKPTAQSRYDALMRTMSRLANLPKVGFQSSLPPTNKPTRTSPTQGLMLTVHDGHNVMKPVQGRLQVECNRTHKKKDGGLSVLQSNALLDGSLKRMRCLDAEAEAFLDDPSMEDAYFVSDVDEGLPTQCCCCLHGQLVSTSGKQNYQSIEVHSKSQSNLDNVDYQIQEMHHEDTFRLRAETED
ncbi:hypothetical protein Tco_0927100 [Tanacetum coccineum]|uniref:Uncharacterized protein n=1 Tax=Tanacetum coccineum TaxID=301880 RepID=A0ABQ5DBT8_9ASTR